MNRLLTQLEAYRAVRKAALPKNRVERPVRGGGYRRRNKHRNPIYEIENS